MPKLKTKSGVKKRFKFTATGKVKHGVAGKRHRLISHNAKYIRQNRGTSVLADADVALELEHVLLLEHVAHQPGVLAHEQFAVLGGHDARGVLAAVLQHRQSVINALIDRADTHHTDDSAHVDLRTNWASLLRR